MKFKDVMMKLVFPIETEEIKTALKYRSRLSKIKREIERETKRLESIMIYPANRDIIARRMIIPVSEWSYLMENMPPISKEINSSLMKRVSSSMSNYQNLWDKKTFLLDWGDL